MENTLLAGLFGLLGVLAGGFVTFMIQRGQIIHSDKRRFDELKFETYTGYISVNSDLLLSRAIGSPRGTDSSALIGKSAEFYWRISMIAPKPVVRAALKLNGVVVQLREDPLDEIKIRNSLRAGKADDENEYVVSLVRKLIRAGENDDGSEESLDEEDTVQNSILDDRGKSDSAIPELSKALEEFKERAREDILDGAERE
jgi:hypothetical protein